MNWQTAAKPSLRMPIRKLRLP